VRILHFSDPHVQLPRWRERKLRELGPLRMLATVELWKGRGQDYDDALPKLRQIVRDADALHAEWDGIGVPADRTTGSRLMPPVDTDYGLREFALVDPNGNLLLIGSGRV
jgi:hypothetical protein